MKKAIALLLLLGLPSAFAFVHSRNGNSILRWSLATNNVSVHTNIVNRNTHAVRYFLATNAFSASNRIAELNALRLSFAQWQAIPGTLLKFEEGGSVGTNIDINTSDHTNVLFWTRTDTLVNSNRDDISGLLGKTYTLFQSDGTLLEADIVFNGYDYEWFSDFLSSNVVDQFIEGTALHEIGHLIGLAHSPIGAATMFYAGNSGVDSQAGLSSDEIAAARFLYGVSNNTRAALKGQVTKSGSGILGAMVILEDSATNIIASTVTRSGGNYQIDAVPPGNYQVRVAPLEATNAGEWLVRGREISSEFNAADGNFLPTSGTNVTLSAGATNTANIAVVNATPAFRISNIRFATSNPNSFSWAGLPTALRVGQANFTVGVASSNLPPNTATLSITGDGLTQGPLTFIVNAFGNTGLNFICTKVSVSANATPGMRSFVVRQGTNVAYANGFFEVLPASVDYNFDGLDDAFQRRYFGTLTAPNAAPAADPDGDTFSNAAEYMAGTNPTNAASYLKIESVLHDALGTTVTWRSVAGKRYQLLSRPQINGAGWTPVGGPVVATGTTSQALHVVGGTGPLFYRVQVLP